MTAFPTWPPPTRDYPTGAVAPIPQSASPNPKSVVGLVARLPAPACQALAAEIAADLPLADTDPTFIELAAALTTYLEGLTPAADLRAVVTAARAAAETYRAASAVPPDGSSNPLVFSQHRAVFWTGMALVACAEAHLASGITRPARCRAWLTEALHAVQNAAEHLARTRAIEHQLARLADLAENEEAARG